MAEARQQVAGSADLPLAQDAVGRLIVTGAVAVPVPMDLKQYLNAPCGPANPIDVEDTGLHTNPRRLEADYGFYSAPTAVVGPAATALWTVATTPARTAGLNTTIYELHIENSTGAAVTAWLEVGGVAITLPYHIASLDTVCIDWPAGFKVGDQDVDLNASAAAVVGQIFGTEI